MEIAGAALGIIAAVMKMVEEAKTASAEKSADILARFLAAESNLAIAQGETHAELDSIKALP
jgi:hypothetical protein